MLIPKILYKYIDIYKTQIRNNIIRETLFRSNLIASIMIDFIWLSIEFILFEVIYGHVTHLGSWTKYEAFFLLGFFFCADSIYVMLFQYNFWRFGTLVTKGELDTVLTKPVNPLFLILSRWIHIPALLNITFGLCIMAYYSQHVGFNWVERGPVLVFWMVISVVIQILMRFLFSVSVFWTDSNGSIARLYYTFYAFSTKPHQILQKYLQKILLTVLPFALIASVPTSHLLKVHDTFKLYYLFYIFGFYFVLNRFLWKAGLRRYQSASS